ncbi:MarR family transcriptional regulator [Corynebacterium liangguodongii]|uniref:MarR family transcriptional regulator n=1 Tax=Corynebacterium liangguodongii TaxID=2079535 RepID=A0A2S0WE23_9CORY|nr:MarR family transcriptional regulator [Corynebacterium liangguodongii]AWB84023.1 MarR family transcriptional regulator [Corynebacterium liangguodongii]PWC00035.1 MarR family transcriptional regulator [Corynebacterium liangguodongii]
MIAVHARYRGREKARAQLVARSARALATLPDVGEFDIVGVEDIRAHVDSPDGAVGVIMALLSDRDWAIGLGIAVAGGASAALAEATAAAGARPGEVGVRVDGGGAEAADIAAVFALIAHVLEKRSFEGREATGLVRRGLSQNEAAAQLGISKQAMSQRLKAAGWQAEQAGIRLALRLIGRAAGVEAGAG